MQILLWGIALLLVINIAARFTQFDLTGFQPNVLTLIGAFFLLAQVSIVKTIQRARRRSFNVVDWLVIIIAGLAIVGVGLSMFGITLAVFTTTQGFVDIGLLLAVIIEIFRPNK